MRNFNRIAVSSTLMLRKTDKSPHNNFYNCKANEYDENHSLLNSINSRNSSTIGSNVKNQSTNEKLAKKPNLARFKKQIWLSLISQI